MNKKFLSIASLALCGAMIFGAGCTPSSGLDTENRRLRLSSGALDGNFNPFFYTAQNDGEIAAMTQLPLMTSNEDGKLVYGQNQACVALDYKATTYDANHNISASGDMEGTTEYEIIIKNGIKFSDGVDLTIKDVLFNFYVYIDPAYTGSATIYSTDIQGLKAYRAQDASMADDNDTDINSDFIESAQNRINALINWSTTASSTSLTTQQQADLAIVERLFREEATSDWTSYETGWVDMYGSEDSLYSFNAAWEAYLFAEGMISVQTRLNANGAYEQVKDENGKYLTTLDPYVSGTNVGLRGAQVYIDGINEATADNLVTAYMNANSVTREIAILHLQRDYCINTVVDNYTDKTNIAQVLTYWATASNALTEFTGDERTKYYDGKRVDGENDVKSVSGVTTYKTTTDWSGNALGAEHDVLKIVINGVDPKAQWNFCFTVAPLHYYSGTFEGVNYVTNFNGVDNFGVVVGSSNFYNTVVRATSKNGLPVGAGSYMASSQNGDPANTRNDFYSNYVVYFMRNEYFTTVGTGIDNAKIKYISYSVMSDASIVDALRTGLIDYGEPNATSANMTEVNTIPNMVGITYQTGGYGYVGINPKYVPNVTIRQAIMKSLDASRTVAYYGQSLAEPIYRPLSKTSWVYDNPTAAARINTEYAAVSYEIEDEPIIQMIEDAGYTKNLNGVYQKGDDVLRYTFTIAGETSDHPAYSMFTEAAIRLNEIGFDITVQTDITALTQLSTGGLAVWAAAWSSSIDPDMYQVYHKDSMATSVNNWNYPEIKYNTGGKWGYEQPIVEELSTKIDEARQLLKEEDRSPLYADCLDLVMDLAIEFPTYQRSTLAVYNSAILDRNSMTEKPSFNLGLIDRIWELDYVK